MNEKTVAIILAGGSGKRMKTGTPKQFLELAGKPVIIHALESFEKSALVTDIIIVCASDYIEKLNKLISKNKIQKVCKVIPGGKTRQESSFIGVKSCPPGTEFVLIHDAVRPFAEEKVIEDVLVAARETAAAAPVIDTEDTLIIKKGDFLEKIPDRNNLQRIQTPQGFSHKTILKAHQEALKNGVTDSTDDCGLVLAMRSAVKLVNGSAGNIKLTEQIDLYLAERLFQLKREKAGNL